MEVRFFDIPYLLCYDQLALAHIRASITKFHIGFTPEGDVLYPVFICTTIISKPEVNLS